MSKKGTGVASLTNDLLNSPRGNLFSAGTNAELDKTIKARGEITSKKVLESAYVLSSGLQSIADEMRRKRYMEEYYLLLDRIDSLEDKILAIGRKPAEIYDSMQADFIPPIEISASEILTIKHCLRPTDIEWIKKMANIYKISPWDLLVNMVECCKTLYFYDEKNIFCISGKTFTFPETAEMADCDFYETFFINLFLDNVIIDVSEVLESECVVVQLEGNIDKFKDETIKCVECDSTYLKRLQKSISSMGFIPIFDWPDLHDASVAADSLKDNFPPQKKFADIKLQYEKKKILSSSDLNYVTEFLAEINRINVESMLENLRTIYAELGKGYRRIKNE